MPRRQRRYSGSQPFDQRSALAFPRGGVDCAYQMLMFPKTKICRFHILGVCERGIGCKFAHDKSELNPSRDLSRAKLCSTLINTGSCEDPACPYAHNRDEFCALLVGSALRSGEGEAEAERAAGIAVAVSHSPTPPTWDERSGEQHSTERNLVIKNTFLEVAGDVDVPLQSRLRQIHTASGRLDTMCC